MNILIQQGDVLLKKVGTQGVFENEYKEIPTDAKKVSGNLLYKGELNSHALFDGEFEMFDYDNVRFVRVIKETTLDHVKDHNSRVRAEHHSQKIEPGDYFLDIVLEYDHLKEESRRIVD